MQYRYMSGLTHNMEPFNRTAKPGINSPVNSSQDKISRSGFLKVAGAGLAAFFLAGCEPVISIIDPGTNPTPDKVSTVSPSPKTPEIAPMQTPENEIIISQSYMSEGEVLAADILVSGVFTEFKNQVLKNQPNATFSAWGALSRGSTGQEYLTPFFEVSENGKLGQEYVVRQKSDSSNQVVVPLESKVIVADDGQEYYTLSQTVNTDTLDPIDPIPLIYIGVPKAQFDVLNAEQQADVKVYFNAFGGILPQESPQLVNIGYFPESNKSASYKELLASLPEQAPTPDSSEIVWDLSNPEAFPSKSFEYLTSTEFAQQVLDWEKEGRFPEVPETAIPFQGIDVLPSSGGETLRKLGFRRIYNVTTDEVKAQTYQGHP